MIDKNSKLVANYLRKAFAGTPEVQRYLAEDNVRFVDIIKTPHQDKITYVGSIGGFKRTMKGRNSANPEIRVEFLSAVQERYTEIMAQTLGYLVFCLDTEKISYHPGMIVENAIPENKLSVVSVLSTAIRRGSKATGRITAKAREERVRDRSISLPGISHGRSRTAELQTALCRSRFPMCIT